VKVLWEEWMAEALEIFVTEWVLPHHRQRLMQVIVGRKRLLCAAWRVMYRLLLRVVQVI
jgi:hypothetical protein